MADVYYNVVTRYRTEGLDRSGRDAEAATESFDRLAESVERVEGLFGKLTTFAAGYTAFSYLKNRVEGLIHTFVGLGSELESLQIQLAGMFQAGNAPGLSGIENFPKALKTADDLIVKMRVHARELPGEFQDVMNIFQPILSTGLSQGRSIDEMESFASRFMAVGASMHIPSAVTGHELEGILLGRTSNLFPLWRQMAPIIRAQADNYSYLTKEQREGLKDEHGSKKVWHALNIDQRMKVLLSATDALQPAIDKVADTWQTISSTFEDYSKNVKRFAGAPVFDEMKKVLSEVNAIYEKNEERIKSTAELFGGALARGIRMAADYAGTLLSVFDKIKGVLLPIAGLALGRAFLGQFNKLGKGWGPGAGSLLGVAGDSASSTAFGSFGANFGMLGSALSTASAQERALAAQHQFQWAQGGKSQGVWGTTARPFFGGVGAGLRQLGRSELMTMEATGMTIGNAVVAGLGRALAGDALAQALDMEPFNRAVMDVSTGLSALPGPIGTLGTAIAGLTAGIQIAANYFIGRFAKNQQADVAAGDITNALSPANWERFTKRYNRLNSVGILSALETLPSQGFIGAGVDALLGAFGKTRTPGSGDYTALAMAPELMREDAKAIAAQTKRVYDLMKERGVVNDEGAINRERLEGSLFSSGAGGVLKDALSSEYPGIFGAAMWRDESTRDDVIQRVQQMLTAYSTAQSVLSYQDPTGKPGEKKAPVVNIYQTNNVYESDDPDRVRVVIRDGIEDALYRSTKSASAFDALHRY